MRIARIFIWSNDRPNDRDEIRAVMIPNLVNHDGVVFQLRTWDLRFAQGESRITDAFYDEVVDDLSRPAAPRFPMAS